MLMKKEKFLSQNLFINVLPVMSGIDLLEEMLVNGLTKSRVSAQINLVTGYM